MGGWIKLHRKLLDNPIAKNGLYAWLWVVLLLKANHKPDKFMWNGGVTEVNEGQLLTGRKALSKDSHIPESTVEDILRFLESQGQIRQQKTNKYRLITITKWKEYQIEQQQTDNKATTNRQHADTYKNDKKVKNDKKGTASQSDASIPLVINLFKEVNPSYQRLFGSPPQRAAAERLLKVHGLNKLSSMIAFLPRSNASRYAPTITTPSQFEAKLGELIAWSQKERQSKGKGIISSS